MKENNSKKVKVRRRKGERATDKNLHNGEKRVKISRVNRREEGK